MQNPATRETALGSALWLRSTNSAGLALDSLGRISDVYLSAGHQRGGLKSVWSGENESDVRVGTSGVTKVGGMTLYGDFSYDYISINSSRYNSILFEPSYDQPYYAADFAVSDWRKQAYDMGFRAATPLFFGGRAAFGLEGRYKALVGAKQMDPRTETYRYDISVAPSAVVRIGEQGALGLKLKYLHSFERSRPSTENNQVEPKVAIMRGLGFYTLATAGGNMGIDIFYYKADLLGGALQYVLRSDEAELMAEFGLDWSSTLVSENPELPRMRGRTEKMLYTFGFAGNFGSMKNHRVGLNAEYGMTSGYEYNQQFDSTPGIYQWITISNPMMSTYDILEAEASYTWYSGLEEGGEYDFRLGVLADAFIMDQRYLVPASKFTASNAALSLSAGWNIPAGKGGARLLPEISAGYRVSPSGEYLYAGTANTDSEIVLDMYPSELEFLTADRLESRVGLAWAIPVAGRSSLCLSLDGGFDYSFSLSDYRLTAVFGVSYLF